jgi:hypothetical protein
MDGAFLAEIAAEQESASSARYQVRNTFSNDGTRELQLKSERLPRQRTALQA